MKTVILAGVAVTTLLGLSGALAGCSSTTTGPEPAAGGAADSSNAGTAGSSHAGAGGAAPSSDGGAAGTQTPSGGGEAGADVGAGGAPIASALSCYQILQCVGDCADGDTACADTCVANGSPEAQTKAGALADCITAQSCTDATCIQTQCTATLNDCVTSSAPAPSGMPLDGAPPRGSVPANLVGTWSHTNFGTTNRIVLNADGTGSSFVGIAGGDAGCITLNSTTDAGNVVVTSDLITIYATKVTNLEKDCSAPTVTTQGDPVVVQIAWSLQDPTTLVIVPVDCAAMYVNNPAGVNLYCRTVLTKQ